jgi:BirA family transcriptional regulator, biotin operon repressor / biotin---[acetyl-CoA-carboxylase] ligase
VLFRTGFDSTNPHVLTRAVALAAASAAEEGCGVSPELKWPNDLLLHGKKLGGILAQAVVIDGRTAVVVGMGLNLGWAPPDAARLAGISPTDFLPVWLRHLAAFLETDTAEAYRARLGTLGRTVRIERAADTLVGTAVDVAPDGALVVDTPQGRHVVTVGDVVHLRSGFEDPSKC